MLDNLVWIDLEMTGLDPLSDHILEIAVIITDRDLNVVSEGPVLAIETEKAILDTMDSWCIKVHGKTGLTQRCLNSNISLEEAEAQVLDLVSGYTGKGQSPLCGNSVHQDKAFMQRLMPSLNNYLHYRIVDVSSFKEMASSWNPAVAEYASAHKKFKHSALDDIRESIEELRRYRDKFIISGM